MLDVHANEAPRQPMDTELPLVEVFPSQLGWMAFKAIPNCLLGLTFGHRSSSAARLALDRATARTPAETQPSFIGSIFPEDLRERLGRFADGERVELGDLPIDVATLTPFARLVVEACRRICWGESRSYGELAKLCGRPGAARAVGSVMARNRFPLVVPCHRVLGAGGKLGGYSAPDGLAMKRRLLTLESS